MKDFIPKYKQILKNFGSQDYKNRQILEKGLFVTAWELLIVSVIYVEVSVRFYWNGNPDTALAFMCYALANLGFIKGAK